MNPGKIWLLLGLIAVSLGMVIADSFSPVRDLKISNNTASVPSSGNGLASVVGRQSMQPQISQRPSLQQMINSGQFNPPPGNTDKMYSIAVPFANSTQTASAPIAQEIDVNGQGSPKPHQGGTLISAWQSNKVAVATPSQGSLSVGNQAQAPPALIQAQAPNQSIIFESPPGVGSTKGGQ